MTAAEGDLIKVITETLPEFPNITLTHVRGHQDRGISYENLPLEAQLNVDCDKEAKRAMREQMIPTTRPDPIKGVGVTLYINGNMLVLIVGQTYVSARNQWSRVRGRKCEPNV